MSTLAVKRRSSLPWASELFDAGNFFGPTFLDFNTEFPALDFANRIPSVNILENDKDFKIEMAAPGLDKKDFKIEVEKGILSISVEKKMESKEEKENYTRKEYSFQSFNRTFRLPENSIPDKVDAKYENGILRLTLPKKEISISKPVKEIKVF
jgi:HSP20 family protein